MIELSKFKWSLSNFENAFEKPKEFLAEPVISERDQAGVIQAFEFTFELAWKTLQKYSHEMGLTINGPKPVLREALKERISPLHHGP